MSQSQLVQYRRSRRQSIPIPGGRGLRLVKNKGKFCCGCRSKIRGEVLIYTPNSPHFSLGNVHLNKEPEKKETTFQFIEVLC